MTGKHSMPERNTPEPAPPAPEPVEYSDASGYVTRVPGMIPEGMRVTLDCCIRCGTLSRLDQHTSEVCQQVQIDQLRARLSRLNDLVDIVREIYSRPPAIFDSVIAERLKDLSEAVRWGEPGRPG